MPQEYGFEDKGAFPWQGILAGAAMAGGALFMMRKGLAARTATRVNLEAADIISRLRQRRLPQDVLLRLETAVGEARTPRPTSLREAFVSLFSETEAMGGRGGWEYWSQQFHPTSILDMLLHGHEVRAVGRLPKFALFPDVMGAGQLQQRELIQSYFPGERLEDLLYARGKVFSLRTGETVSKEQFYLYPVFEGAFGQARPRGYTARHIDKMLKAPMEPSPDASIIEKIRHYLDIGYRGGRGEEPFYSGAFWKRMFGDFGEFARSVYGEPMGGDVRQTGFGLIKRGSLRNTISSLFTGGRRSPQDISSLTVNALYMLDRMNEALARTGFSMLALSGRSTKDPLDMFLSIGLKRYLPIAALLFYAGYANYEVEQLTGEKATGHFGRTLTNISLDIAGLKDITGVTPFAKHWAKIVPQVEYLAHPFVEHPIGLSREELEEYYSTGREPVRKGRWWGFLSTSPYRGGRIQYFQPPLLARMGGYPEKEESVWGSYDEYLKHAFWPTPRHPVSPITHLLDPYALEKRAYYEYPAPVTAPLFEEWTPYGMLLNMTIGRLLKPERPMHVGEVAPEVPGEERPIGSGATIAAINESLKRAAMAKKHYAYITPSGEPIPTWAASPPGATAAAGVGAEPRQPRRRMEYTNQYIKYLADRRRKVKGRTAEGYVLLPVRPGETRGLTPEMLGDLETPQTFEQQLKRSYYLGTELGGIYGYALSTLTGYPGETQAVYQNIGRITSFEHAFWEDMNIGGLGGELSEIARRFFPHRLRLQEEYNPIYNRTIASWLPGVGTEEPNYFIDFHTGIPQTKVVAGGHRLPGSLYEKIHGLDIFAMPARGSMLGKNMEEMIDYFLGRTEAPEAWEEALMEAGTKIHAKVEASIMRKGAGLVREHKVFDPRHNISGTIDVVVQQGNQQVPVEIKTLGEVGFLELNQPYRRHMEQLNFYIKAMGAKKGYMYYTSRKDPSKYKVFEVPYSHELFGETVGKLEAARNTVTDMFSKGMISRGELYPVFHRFKILADVAPWSQQYLKYRDYLTHSGLLTSEEREEFVRVKKQVTRRKRRYDISPYHFKYADITKEQVTVSRVIDANTFMVREHPDEVFRLAGVRISTAKGSEGAEWVSRYLREGSKVTVGYTADEVNRRAKDTLRTIRATVWAGGTNVNLAAIREGYGKEKETEWTPAGVHARFTPFEITVGKAAEYISHFPIPWVHAKWMPEDSALETYKRTRVYGQEFQPWSIKTLMQGIMGWGSHGLLVAPILGGAVGYFLGRTGFKAPLTGAQDPRWFAKIGRGKGLGAIVGASIGLTTAILVKAGGGVPGERKKEREIEEYFDILKYLKYKGLYEKTADEVKEREGVDLPALVEALEIEGRRRGELKDMLANYKRRLTMEPKPDEKALKRTEGLIEELESKQIKAIDRLELIDTLRASYKELPPEGKKLYQEHREYVDVQEKLTKREAREIRKKLKERSDEVELYSDPDRASDEKIKRINRALRTIAERRSVMPISELAAQALYYRQQSMSTMFGADVYGPWLNVMRAFPAKEREFISHFMTAAPEEREEVLKLLPSYEKRFFEARWTPESITPRPELEEYFKEHYLPPPDWTGWQSESHLEDYKLKVIKHEGLDLRESDFWPREERMVEAQGIKTLPFKTTTGSRGAIIDRIKSVLSGIGVEDVWVNIYSNPSMAKRGFTVNIDVAQDREDDVRDYIKDNQRELINER